MATKQTSKSGSKHRLILYRLTSHRFRPPGILLIFMGVLALIPSFIAELRFKNAILNYQQLAILGVASIALGLVLYIGSVMAARRAYVQCLPDYFLVNTMFTRVYVAYQRVNSTQPVQFGRMFDVTTIKKDSEKKLIKSLAGETALQVDLSEFPLPEKKLRKMFSRFMFNTRGEGFVFLVPKPTALSLEISSFSQAAKDTRNEDQQRYLDPIERLKYQENKTY